MIKEIYKKQGGSIGGFVLDFIQSIVLALAVFVLLYLFVAQPNEVNGSSMVPNFIDKEFLLTEKLSYQFGVPQRGDVIVFKAPASEPCSPEECEYIKRVIGIPGDEIMIKDGQVYLNGELLDQGFLSEGVSTDPGQYLEEGVSNVIPKGQYLCFGDNRKHSRDGREFGPIKESLIVGKAFLKYWPVSALGLVPTIRF
jgi:signal peptidase I